MKKEVILVLFLAVIQVSLAQDLHFLISDTKNLKIIEINKTSLIWEYKCPGSCFCKEGNCFLGYDSATRLDDGNTLLVDNHQNRIIEVNADGIIAWKYGTGSIGNRFNEISHPKSAYRLDNGNTLIADSGNNRVIEVEKSKNVMWEYGCDNKFLDCTENSIYENLKNPSSARPTKKGTILIADTENNRVIEVEKSKNQIVWGFGCTVQDVFKKCSADPKNLFKPMYAIRLENTTLIADSGNDRVIEVSDDNKIVWQYGIMKGKNDNELNFPTSANPLPNGNIVITDTANERIIEVNKSTNKIVFEYGGLKGPLFAESPKVNLEYIRTKAPSCYQGERGFLFEFPTTINPKYIYVRKKNSENKIFLVGSFENKLFTSKDDKVIESGQYEFFANFDSNQINYSVYCKLDKILCPAINLSIDDCYMDKDKLVVEFSGLGEQNRFVSFKNLFLKIITLEKIFDDSSSRICGANSRYDLSRFGEGSFVNKTGNDSYKFFGYVGNLSLKSVEIEINECCGKNESNKTKTKNLRCREVMICDTDYDCNDGNPYTLDMCINQKCVNQRKNISCVINDDCNDFNKCTNDVCINGACQNNPTCTGCSYCDGGACISNETCLLQFNTDEKTNVLSSAKNQGQTGGRFWYYFLLIILVIVSCVASSGTVYYLFKEKMKKMEQEYKETIEKEQQENKKMQQTINAQAAQMQKNVSNATNALPESKNQANTQDKNKDK